MPPEVYQRCLVCYLKIPPLDKYFMEASAVNQNKIQRNLCSKGHRDYKYCKHYYYNGRLNMVIKQGLVHREAYTI